MSRKAMELALDALENHTAIKHPQESEIRDKAIDALQVALAEPNDVPLPSIAFFAQEIQNAVSKKERQLMYVINDLQHEIGRLKAELEKSQTLIDNTRQKFDKFTNRKNRIVVEATPAVANAV